MMIETLLYIYMSHTWNRVLITPPGIFRAITCRGEQATYQ